MGNIKIIRNKHTFRADTGKEYIWVAYVMGSSKAYTTPDKKKEKTFGQFGSIAREFEIMIFAPNDKTLNKENHLGMLTIRVDNKGRIIEEEVAKQNVTPKILEVNSIKMGDGDPNKVSYQDTLLVWANTQGLQDKEITFKLLWNNDDEPKKVFKAKVDNKDRAEVKIPLITYPDVLDAYVKNKTSKDKSTEHTFKVEASFGEPPKTNGKKATQVKGEIKDAYFIDKNGEKVTKLKKGDVVRVCIESEGMINKYFQYFILEKDKYTPDDSITSSGVLTFKGDIFIGRPIEIDDEKLLWGGKDREGEDRYEQDYIIKVKTFKDSKISKPKSLILEEEKDKTFYSKSPVKVSVREKSEKEKTPSTDGLFLPDIQIKEVYEIKEDKKVSLKLDKESKKQIKVLDEKTSIATEYKDKDIKTVKQTSSMIIRFSVTPRGGKKIGYLGLFLTTIPEAENLYGYELYYNYKNVLSPSIASITIKEGEKERPFGSGYTTKINGKETEFELKIIFNKNANSDVFIDIFSNTNAPLAKPTLSGTALHRFKMKIWGNVLPPWMKIAFEKFKKAKGVSEGKDPLFSFAKSCLEFGGNNSRPDNNVSGQWCAAFVSWCVNEAKYKVGEKGEQRVRSQQFIRLAEEGKVYKIIDKPVVGCIVVMSNYKKDTQKPDGSGHVTFLYAIDGNNLVCLGGNQGDRLKFSNYKRNGVNFNFSKNGSIYQQKFNCFLMPIDYPEALYNYNIPKLTADEANKKHFLNLETEENEQTF